MNLAELLPELLKGILHFTWGNAVMITAALILIYLAVYQGNRACPVAADRVWLPAGEHPAGRHDCRRRHDGRCCTTPGLQPSLFPLLIFVGVGAMIDFSPLLAQPKMALLGAAGQFGIFGTLILAIALGFPLNQAASIGVIGAIDGPTSIFVAAKLAPELLAPIAVAAYSYMSLIPIIQPPLMKLLTTKKERLIRMEYAPKPISQKTLVFFPMYSNSCGRFACPGSHTA